MTNPRMNSKKRSILARAARTAVPVTLCVAMLTQLGAEGADQPATQPTTQPTNHNATTQRAVTSAPGGGLMFNFQETPIMTVLDELSAAGGFIIVPLAKPTGRISATSLQPLTPRDAISLLNTLIKPGGFAAIQQGRVLKIVALADAKHSSIPVRIGSDPEKIESTDELITQVIPLRQADATQLKGDLAPLINPDADFTSNQSSNSLIITDTAANIKRVVEIVNGLDSHLAESAEVRAFRLEFASATAAAQLINQLFQQQGGGGGGFGGFGGGGNPFGRFFGGGGFGGGGFGGFGGGGQGGGGGGGPGGGGGGPGGGGGGGGGGGRGNQGGGRTTVPVRAAADDRTNTVVVSGPTETLNGIANILHQLDANPAAEENVFIYRLKNAQSANVQNVLNGIFNGTSTGTSNNTRNGLSSNNISGGSRAFGSGGIGSGGGRSGGGGFGGGGGLGGGGGGVGLGGGGGGIGTNRTGGFGGTTGGFGGGFGGLSSSAAQAAAGLAGQVTIIADTDTNSLLVRTKPVNYPQVKEILDVLDRPVGQVLIKVLIAEVSHDNSQDLGAEWSVINLSSGGNGQKVGTAFQLPTFSPADAVGGTGLLAQIISGDVTATIHALQSAGKIDVLSRPYILASDNQLAEIVVGQEVPFITDTRTTDTGNTINTVQYGDVGVLVDVVPHINSEGLVILDVAPEISSLTNSQVPIASNVSAPIFDRRSAQSRVGVKDGQTVVIGGLMQDRKESTIDKVPILGDIPFVGEAFRHTNDKTTKTELLIFLTPHVALQPDLLKPMAESELRGTKLVPQAVYPGAFDEHKEGLERGGATTQPDQPGYNP